MTDLKASFDAAVAASKELSERPDNATLLKLYGLYKQATEGDNAAGKPGFGDMVARAKWDAWNALKGTPGEEAMRRYIELVDSLD
jgi:diazepam-binding inhibitor (GABA receptor modulating acyl-CoA-binding protein)